jgi:hypothetical protein
MGNAGIINWTVLLISLATLMPMLVTGAYARSSAGTAPPSYGFFYGGCRPLYPSLNSLPNPVLTRLNRLAANALGDIVATSKTGLPDKFAQVNGQIEQTVGRAAMVGMGLLLLVESATGAAFFF